MVLPSLLVFPQQVKIGKCCHPGTLQHIVIFYQKCSSQVGTSNSFQSPHIGQNSDGDISKLKISGQSLIKENCHNSRTNDNIDMKLGPVTKLDKRNIITSKNFTMTIFQKIGTTLSFFQSMANLVQSRSQIPDAQSVKLIFLLIVLITTF